MPLTPDQLANLPFGYLSGADLIQWSAEQLLIKQYNVYPNSLVNGCNIAYSELISLLNTRYNLAAEFAKQGFTNAAAVASVTGGAVTEIDVAYAGSNYGSVPNVVIGGPGTGAMAVAIMSGSVTGINMTSGGSGYLTAPIVSFTGGGGSGATGTAILVNGTITGINITSGGTGYTSAPAITFTGGSGTGAAASSVISGIITGINVTAGGTGYTTAPSITITGGDATDPRTMIFVKLSAICAIRNILGNLQNIGEAMTNNFAWADATIKALRMGDRGMPTINQAPTATYGAPAEIVAGSFLTLG